MLIVETIARIRREHFIKGKTIKEIARDLKVSRNTVRKVLRYHEVVLLNGVTVIVKAAHVRG
jgi:predicted transcriptional regulator